MNTLLKLPSSEPLEIVFENVSFSYPSRKETLALNEASFTIRAGTTVAFVGGSGSGKIDDLCFNHLTIFSSRRIGKSTCIQLLLRFYNPADGHIKINGRKIDEYDIDDLRQTIGIVNQEPVLFVHFFII